MWFNGIVKQSGVMQDIVSVTFRHSTAQSWFGYGNQFVKINVKNATVRSRKHTQPILLHHVHIQRLISNKSAAKHLVQKTAGRKYIHLL
jgi:hypothetical protein